MLGAFRFSTLALIAILLLLVNAPLIAVGVTHTNVDFSLVLLFFVSRHVLCAVAAYPVARLGNIGTLSFALFFAVPSLVLIHGLIIWTWGDTLELWPPVLFLDAALFSPAVILYNLIRRRLGEQQLAA